MFSEEEPVEEELVMEPLGEIILNNIEAYKILFDLERSLRKFISKILQENYKEGWMNNISKKIIKNCEYRASLEKDSCHDTFNEDSALIINFADFKDLKKIIIQHWTLFEPYFQRRDLIENKLEELEIPRNIIAHNRRISNNELHRISVYAHDLKFYINRE